MRSAEEIRALRNELEDNIFERGWDASVEAASQALAWVLGSDIEGNIRQYTFRPDAERRREWIARGGDPKDWPIEPERPVSSEEKTA
jgi:hypothetical protein